jgi:hypothetical protein
MFSPDRELPDGPPGETVPGEVEPDSNEDEV